MNSLLANGPSFSYYNSYYSERRYYQKTEAKHTVLKYILMKHRYERNSIRWMYIYRYVL